jgi:uncharacterized membrane protein
LLRESISYLIATAILIVAILAFFVVARNRYAPFGLAQVLLRILAALPLVGSAIYVHFLNANQATAMLPPGPAGVPSPLSMVIFSGICELLGAIGLFLPRLRRSAALWIAIMMVFIFPVNVFVAGQIYFGVQMPSVPERLTAQIIYIWIVLLAGYGMPGRGRRKTRPLARSD